jgi:hypothetical protein
MRRLCPRALSLLFRFCLPISEWEARLLALIEGDIWSVAASTLIVSLLLAGLSGEHNVTSGAQSNASFAMT